MQLPCNISSNFIDLDTKILNIQGGPLLTYLMTSPKLKELTVSLNDNSLKDKLWIMLQMNKI